jgi:signal transduction histidine kinase
VVWITGAFSFGIAVVALATYHAALQQIGTLFDAALTQIAQAVHLREDWAEAGNVRIAQEEVAFAVRAYDDGGRIFFESGLPSLPPDAPKTLDPGFSVVDTPDGPWRVYTHVTPEGVIQVAQAEALRDALARQLSLRMLLPELLFLPVLALLVAWILKRALAPLDETSARVRERNAARLDPLPSARVPSELAPLVEQVNALLGRLSASLEAERRFVADAAHELRSPVAALALQIQLAERATTDAARAAALAELKKGVARTGRLVQQLLDLARLEPGIPSEVPGPVDLAQLARDVIASFAARADAQGVDLGADAPPSVMVTGRASELRSLVANLVDNALRYAPPQTSVTVSLRDASGAVELAFEDAGPGIPVEQRERVMRRFQRVDGDLTAGSGLGLPIAKAIVERHGGSLMLGDARPGRQPPGLGVRIRLPTAQPAQTALAPRRAA